MAETPEAPQWNHLTPEQAALFAASVLHAGELVIGPGGREAGISLHSGSTRPAHISGDRYDMAVWTGSDRFQQANVIITNQHRSRYSPNAFARVSSVGALGQESPVDPVKAGAYRVEGVAMGIGPKSEENLYGRLIVPRHGTGDRRVEAAADFLVGAMHRAQTMPLAHDLAVRRLGIDRVVVGSMAESLLSLWHNLAIMGNLGETGPRLDEAWATANALLVSSINKGRNGQLPGYVALRGTRYEEDQIGVLFNDNDGNLTAIRRMWVYPETIIVTSARRPSNDPAMQDMPVELEQFFIQLRGAFMNVGFLDRASFSPAGLLGALPDLDRAFADNVSDRIMLDEGSMAALLEKMDTLKQVNKAQRTEP